MSELIGPQTLVARQTHEEKYEEPGEGFVGSQKRLARALCDDDSHRVALEDIFISQRFMAAGRVQAAMGSWKKVTAYNCFIGGVLQDTFVDGEGSIMHRALQAAQTMRSGGGLGTNYGTLRPKGSLVRKLNSVSSGPVTFMHIQDAVGRATSSAGNRRGAQMAAMPIWHPDIEEFIDAKKPPADAQPIMDMVDHWREQASFLRDNHAPPEDVAHAEAEFWKWFNALQTTLRLTGFNVSVGVTDEFMGHLSTGEPFSLRWGGKKYRDICPVALWEKIMRSTWDWAEPGVLFLDTINRENNLWYCEQIWVTNPCGEQPMPADAACLLGSFCLPKYLVRRSDGSLYLDLEQLAADVLHVVRAMDNVVDRTNYPLPEQEREAQAKRRMGLGVTGLANALEALGAPYGSETFIATEGLILRTISHACYHASIQLAAEKGAFPMLDVEKYLASGHNKRVLTPEHIAGIRRHGIRNSHLTSIAPTGTISLCADNVSSSIEPVFAYGQKRVINFKEGRQEVDLQDFGFAKFGVRGRKADQVSAREHLAVLAEAQKWVDSGVSKTCNVSGDMPWADFKDLYHRAWSMGCKGITTFNKDGRRAGILRDLDEDVKACTIDPTTGQRSCE